MKLSIKERIVFPMLFPNKSDLVTLRLVSDVSKKIEFSQKEIEEIKLFIDGNQYHWDNTVDLEIDVEFTELELKMFKDKIKEMDEAKAIPLELLGLIDKILPNEAN